MMLRKYALKMGIGMIKLKVVVEDKEFYPGNIIGGHFWLEGGIFPIKIKRYDIDLVVNHFSNMKEDIINSHSVICSSILNANEKKEVPFLLEIPLQAETISGNKKYSVIAKVILEYDQVLTEVKPIIIKENC